MDDFQNREMLIAHVKALVLATTNDRDFAPFKGLTVENWSKRHLRSKP